MKKIILLCLVFKALNLHGIWTNLLYPFMNDKTLTKNQEDAMKNYQDIRLNPNNMFPAVCECTSCGNYMWDTCGSQNGWVKNGLCSYGNLKTLYGCS